MVPLKQLLSEPCELTGPAPQTWLETSSVHPSPLPAPLLSGPNTMKFVSL